jgi:hypothetical protein
MVVSNYCYAHPLLDRIVDAGIAFTRAHPRWTAVFIASNGTYYKV